ncbi:hypothetical protein AYO43_10170 [Nitrospira sp. SCGC AG-212-E16]|nr:hypothetical protein AYO43_10170 [Nitrospira sp. SCGC AG-212-E16]
MNSNSVSSVSHAKRRVQAASKVPRNELPTTLQELKAAARRCQTPKQFRELLAKEKGRKKRGQATFLGETKGARTISRRVTG